MIEWQNADFHLRITAADFLGRLQVRCSTPFSNRQLEFLAERYISTIFVPSNTPRTSEIQTASHISGISDSSNIEKISIPRTMYVRSSMNKQLDVYRGCGAVHYCECKLESYRALYASHEQDPEVAVQKILRKSTSMLTLGEVQAALYSFGHTDVTPQEVFWILKRVAASFPWDDTFVYTNRDLQSFPWDDPFLYTNRNLKRRFHKYSLALP